MEARENFDHWQNLAQVAGATLGATTRCRTIKVLEIDALARALERFRPDLADGGEGLVVEVGCGVGLNLLGLQSRFPHLSYLGLDFVPEMLQNAREHADEQLRGRPELRKRLAYARADVRAFTWPDPGLTEQLPSGFASDHLNRELELVFTDRCLVNLSSTEEQIAVVRRIRSALSSQGRFLMLENSRQTAANLNRVRDALGLPAKEAAEFNVFIDEPALTAGVGGQPEAVWDFGGLHDLILYGIDAAQREGQHVYDTSVMQAATQAALALNEAGWSLPVGQNRLWIWGGPVTEIRRCSRCVLPETHETIVFDEDGVCNICRQQEVKQGEIDWAAKKLELDALVERYRGQGDYDCLVPFSGGKDSTWTLYYLVKEYGLKPLVVRFDHGFLRERVQENTVSVTRLLGTDLHTFTPDWRVVRRVMLQSFLEKGDFCWHCHTGIFAYPMWVALRFQIPLIVWGEPSAEYTAYYGYDQDEEVDEKRFNRYVNLGIAADDMLVRLDGAVDERDMKPFSYPPLKELRKLNVRSICLGSYVPWDVKRQVAVIKQELGWQGDQVENVPPGYDYEKIECFMQGVRDYIKYVKRGYTRPAHLASIDIRNQRMTREEGLQQIETYENKRPPSLDRFLEFVGLTEEEFLEVAMSHGVSPYEHQPASTVPGERVHDADRWPRLPGLPREEALEQLKTWRVGRRLPSVETS